MTRSKWSLLFASLVSFFSFRLSFSSFDKCVKEAAPFEREQRERTSSPSFFVVFSPIIKSHHSTTTASEDVIYIYTNTYTRHTKHIAILYDSQ